MSSRNDTELKLDQHILAAAQRLLTGGDETSMTMDRLAAESGVSRATIYRRFGGRPALLKRLADEYGVSIRELDVDANIRNRILHATQLVVGASGSLDITIEQVAAEAEVGVATIYRHFGSKDQLLQSMAQHFPLRSIARELLDPSSDRIEDDLLQFAQYVLEVMQGRESFARLLFSSDPKVQHLLSSVRADQDRTLTTLTRYLDAQIQAGRLRREDPFSLATALVGMIVGFVLIKPTYTDVRDDPAQVARFIVDLFLTGIEEKQP